MVVQHGGQQVIGSTDGMEVTGEVQVDIFHGDDLCITAAGSTALDAEHGAQRRLTQAQHGLLTQPAQGIGQANRSGGLAFTGRCGVDGSNEDQLALAGQILQGVDVQLALGAAVGLQSLFADAHLGSDVTDGEHSRFLCDLNITLEHNVSSAFCRSLRPA